MVLVGKYSFDTNVYAIDGHYYCIIIKPIRSEGMIQHASILQVFYGWNESNYVWLNVYLRTNCDATQLKRTKLCFFFPVDLFVYITCGPFERIKL